LATLSPGQENKPSISQNPLAVLLGAILVFVVLLELLEFAKLCGARALLRHLAAPSVKNIVKFLEKIGSHQK
jgi:hypothetical protein